MSNLSRDEDLDAVWHCAIRLVESIYKNRHKRLSEDYLNPIWRKSDKRGVSKSRFLKKIKMTNGKFG